MIYLIIGLTVFNLVLLLFVVKFQNKLGELEDKIDSIILSSPSPITGSLVEPPPPDLLKPSYTTHKMPYEIPHDNGQFRIGSMNVIDKEFNEVEKKKQETALIQMIDEGDGMYKVIPEPSPQQEIIPHDPIEEVEVKQPAPNHESPGLNVLLEEIEQEEQKKSLGEERKEEDPKREEENQKNEPTPEEIKTSTTPSTPTYRHPNNEDSIYLPILNRKYKSY